MMRTITRKDFITLAASAGAGSLLLGALPHRRASAHAGMPSYITNALEHQTYDMYTEWAAWLRNAGRPGYLGEHSVPNSSKPLATSEVDKWLTLFDKVYRILDANVDVIQAVSAHTASIYEDSTNGFRIYGPDKTNVSLLYRNFAVAFEQAPVVEAHPPVPGSLRGMNTSSGANIQSGFSRSNPGTYGQNYVYPDQADFAYLRTRGHNLTRIPFRWERVQPQLNNPLKSVEMARLKSSFDAAAAVGMKVIPNLHNPGCRYYFGVGDYAAIGSTRVPISAYKDVWARLAEAWNGHPAIAGYDIMNEAFGLQGGIPTWEKASQAAVDGIRSRDATTRIWVCGWNKRDGYYNNLFCFVANHPTAWITGTNVGYTCHAYYGPGTGYKRTYDEAVAYWQGQGY
ncbi:MAG: glycoside hydrolase family 5 protein [Actinomycetota bacterium]|nr:glycoside hydrolase family 5 protein [Actinomycetota bacterium]